MRKFLPILAGALTLASGAVQAALANDTMVIHWGHPLAEHDGQHDNPQPQL